MPTPFLSSEEYDERAHQLYNEGQYEEALEVLDEGLSLYPSAVELHIGAGYAQLAREEYAWARRAFDRALVLEPEHEDALAGTGEVLLKLGRRDEAMERFDRIVELGYSDDVDMLLQVGRALFREDSRRMPLMADARRFFDLAVRQVPDSAEAVALLGFSQHRLGDDASAVVSLRRALALDDEHVEARIYLANILYDRGEYEEALAELERTSPEDHWDELAIWRYLELKRSLEGVPEGHASLAPWEERIGELTGEMDEIDEMLAELESRAAEADEQSGEGMARGQLELFGVLLSDLADRRRDGHAHHVMTREGRELRGTWEDIVRELRDLNGAFAGRSLHEFMVTEARRVYSLTGVEVKTHDPESFIRDSASAGLLRILR